MTAGARIGPPLPAAPSAGVAWLRSIHATLDAPGRLTLAARLTASSRRELVRQLQRLALDVHQGRTAGPGWTLDGGLPAAPGPPPAARAPARVKGRGRKP